MLLLAGCTSSPDPGGRDSETTAVTGCVEDDGVFEDVAIDATDVPTVFRATWRSPGAGTVRVGDRELDAGGGPDHTALIVGLRASTDYEVVLTDGGTTCSSPRALTTGAFDAALPPLVVSGEGSGYTALTVIGETHRYPVILDAEGQYVWAWPGLDGMLTRTVLSADRTAVITIVPTDAVDGEATLHRIALDGSEDLTLTLTGGSLDFAELPDRRYAWVAQEMRVVGDRTYVGDRIVELDEDGGQTEVWNAFDAYPPDADHEYPQYYLPDRDGTYSLSHVNGLFYDAGEDAYFVVLDALQAVARVDRASGAVAWTLSDAHGDFTVEGSPVVMSPHSVQWLGDGVLIFNRMSLQGDDCSEATEVRFDGATATRTWSYASADCYQVYWLGHAERLDDGNTQVVWSTAGQLDEVDADGNVVLQVNTPMGAGFGFARFVGAW